jgi:ubiquitin carboxyl-terminal hydrolase 5/13
LKSLFGKGHPEFSTSKQQDAREYFHYFVEKLSKLERKHKGVHDPSKAFEFEMETRLECLECNQVKYNTQSDNQLILMAPVDSGCEAGTDVSLQACFEGFFAGSIIDDFKCPACNKPCSFSQVKRFKTFPKYLVVVLQRFVFHNWVPRKLDVNLQFDVDTDYNFAQFMSAGP